MRIVRFLYDFRYMYFAHTWNQANTIECRYNVVQYNMILHTLLRQSINRNSYSQQTPHITPSYLTLTGKLWGVYCEEFGENWLRYNGTALYKVPLKSCQSRTVGLAFILDTAWYCNSFEYQVPVDFIYCYRKTSNISCTLVGNKIDDHSDVVGALPVGAAPTTSSFSTEHPASMDRAKTIARLVKKHLSLGI